MTPLTFSQVELIPNGVNIPVTPQNVYEYVRKYAEHRMLVVAEQPLHVSVFQKVLLDPMRLSVFLCGKLAHSIFSMPIKSQKF